MPETFTRRLPYSNIKVSKLKEMQGRIAVLGTVVSKDKENFSFLLDDGEAQVLVITNDIASFEKVEDGKLIRVMGKTMGSGDEVEILAEVLQDFSKIDKERYFKYMLS